MAKEAPILRELEVDHEAGSSPYQSSTIWITSPHGGYFYGSILYYHKNQRSANDSILDFRTHTVIGESIEDVQDECVAWIEAHLGKVQGIETIEE